MPSGKTTSSTVKWTLLGRYGRNMFNKTNLITHLKIKLITLGIK